MPGVGALLRRPALARTLREVAETGRASLYGGRLGEVIARASDVAGGLLGMDDLATHRAEIEAPVQTSYRGATVYQPPLPSQGLILLEMLNILERFDIAGLDLLGDQLIHIVAEAKRLAFEDRLRWCGDPRFVDVPLARLLSKEYARERGAQIRPDAIGAPAAVGPTAAPSQSSDTTAHDTTCCCAVDAAGNAVVLIHSLASNWGSAFVVDDTGILLNNRAGGSAWTRMIRTAWRPGKRTMNTLNCCMLGPRRPPDAALGHARRRSRLAVERPGTARDRGRRARPADGAGAAALAQLPWLGPGPAAAARPSSSLRTASTSRRWQG